MHRMGTCSMHLDLDMMGCARFLPRVDASLSGSGVSITLPLSLTVRFLHLIRAGG